MSSSGNQENVYYSLQNTMMEEMWGAKLILTYYFCWYKIIIGW